MGQPKAAKTTVGEWCDTWLAGYGTRKPRTVRQAEVHLAKIKDEFGTRRLDSIRPSEVKSWTVKLRDAGLADSYVYAIHARLAQVFSRCGPRRCADPLTSLPVLRGGRSSARPLELRRAFRAARAKVKGLPPGFRSTTSGTTTTRC